MEKTKSMPPELKSLCGIEQLFDFYRIVQPATKIVYDYRDGILQSQGIHCYRALQRNSPCINCISSRSCRDQKSYVKLEYIEGKTYLFYAIPIQIGESHYALELLKDVTASMVVPNTVYSGDQKMVSVVHNFNTLAALDPLTGLYNKDYILQQLEMMIAGRAPEKRVFGAIVDIEQLKQTNDRYGVAAGDLVIKTIGTVLQTRMKELGYLTGRFAGDEFICICEHCDEKTGMRACQELEERIRELTFEYQGQAFHVKVVAYGGVYQPGQDCGQFLTYLDNRLYEEKKKRRMNAFLAY